MEIKKAKLFLLLMIILQYAQGEITEKQVKYLGNSHLLPTEEFLGYYDNNKTLGLDVIGADIFKKIIGDRNIFTKYLEIVLSSTGSSEIKSLIFETESMINLLSNVQKEKSSYTCTILNMHDAINEAYEVLVSDSATAGAGSNPQASASNIDFVSHRSNRLRRYSNKKGLGKKTRNRPLMRQSMDKLAEKLNALKNKPYNTWTDAEKNKLHIQGQTIFKLANKKELFYLVNRLNAGVDTTRDILTVKMAIRKHIRDLINEMFPNPDRIGSIITNLSGLSNLGTTDEVSTDTPPLPIPSSTEEYGEPPPKVLLLGDDKVEEKVPQYKNNVTDTQNDRDEVRSGINPPPSREDEESINPPLEESDSSLPGSTDQFSPNESPMVNNPIVAPSGITPLNNPVLNPAKIDPPNSPINLAEVNPPDSNMGLDTNPPETSDSRGSPIFPIGTLDSTQTNQNTNNLGVLIPIGDSKQINLNTNNLGVLVPADLSNSQVNDLVYNAPFPLEDFTTIGDSNDNTGKFTIVLTSGYLLILEKSSNNLLAKIPTNMSGESLKKEIEKIQADISKMTDTDNTLAGKIVKEFEAIEALVKRVNILEKQKVKTKLQDLSSNIIGLEDKIPGIMSRINSLEDFDISTLSDRVNYLHEYEIPEKLNDLSLALDSLEKRKVLTIDEVNDLIDNNLIVKANTGKVSLITDQGNRISKNFDGIFENIKRLNALDADKIKFQTESGKQQISIDKINGEIIGLDSLTAKSVSDIITMRQDLGEVEERIKKLESQESSNTILVDTDQGNTFATQLTGLKLDFEKFKTKANPFLIWAEIQENGKLEREFNQDRTRLDIIEGILAKDEKAIDDKYVLVDNRLVVLEGKVNTIEGLNIDSKIHSITSRVKSLEDLDSITIFTSMKNDIKENREKQDRESSHFSNKIDILESRLDNDRHTDMTVMENLPENFINKINSIESQNAKLTELERKIDEISNNIPHFSDLTLMPLNENKDFKHITDMIDTLESKVDIEVKRVNNVIDEQKILKDGQKREVRAAEDLKLKIKTNEIIDISKLTTKATEIIRKLQDTSVSAISKKRAVTILLESCRQVMQILTNIIGHRPRTRIVHDYHLKECLTQVADEPPKALLYHNEVLNIFYKASTKGFKYSPVFFGRTPQWQLRTPPIISSQFPPEEYCLDFVETEGQLFCLKSQKEDINCNKDNKKVCQYNVDFLKSGRNDLIDGMEMTCIEGDCQIQEKEGGRKIAKFLVSKEDLGQYYTHIQAGVTAISRIWGFIRNNNVGLIILYVGAATHLIFLIHFIYQKWCHDARGRLRWLPFSRNSCKDFSRCIRCKEGHDEPRRIRIVRPTERTDRQESVPLREL